MNHEHRSKPLKCKPPRRGGGSRRRRGAVTLEAIVAVPVLVIVTFAIVQYGILVLVHATVTQAATVGVREAAKGATTEQVVEYVNEILAVHGFEAANVAGSGAKVVLEDGSTTSQSIGDPGLNCFPTGPELTPNEVRVTVCVDLTKSPFLNALTTFGFDLTGKRLEVSALLQKEV